MLDTRHNLLIVGAGGAGREALSALSYVGDNTPLFRARGFLDSRTDILKSTPRSIGIVGDPLTYHPLPNEVFMAALGDPHIRFKYTAALRDVHNANFITIVHPTANISQYTSVQRGCIIAQRTSISVDCQIGEFTCIQEYTIVGHDAQIGNWCQINSHCTIAGGARIGNFVTIHPNSVVTSRAVIGDGAVIGAGSVVIGRIPAGITVMGNPARRFDFK